MNRPFFTCIILAIFSINNVYTQNVPNGDFENWGTRILYEEPVSWNTGNMLSFVYDQTTAVPTTDSYNGNYALRLEAKQSGEEVLFGFALSDGIITEGSLEEGFQFTGGIPLSGTPTQLSGFYKYSIPFGDAGIIMISFKKNGVVIGEEYHLLLFNSNSYSEIDIPISDLPDIPDTALIAFASTNPANPRTGGWLQVDSLWFSGINDPVPNGNFEEWENEEYYDPSEWMSANLFTNLFGGDTSATRTADAHSGEYAIRIESVETYIPDDDGMITANMGFLMPYSEQIDLSESLPSFPVDFNPTSLAGYYKFYPHQDDTASVFVILTDSEGNEYRSDIALPAANEYTPFTLMFSYPYQMEITGISIVASTSLYFDTSLEQTGELGSVLYLDDLELMNECFFEDPFAIGLTRYPDCDDPTAILDAGEGWGSYYWSTGETTRIISIEVTEAIAVSVIVTAADSWCAYVDTVDLIPAENCADYVGHDHSADNSFSIFPNPAQDEIHIHSGLLSAGSYTVELFSLSGTRLVTDIISTEGNLIVYRFDDRRPETGYYLLKISGDRLVHYQTVRLK
jgi:hypothetical protein